MRMSIERSPGVERPAVGELGQPRAAQRLARVAGEDVEQVELHRGQRDLAAVGVAQQRASVSKVQRPIRSAGRAGGAGARRPPRLGASIRRSTARMRARSSRGSKGFTT